MPLRGGVQLCLLDESMKQRVICFFFNSSVSSARLMASLRIQELQNDLMCGNVFQNAIYCMWFITLSQTTLTYDTGV